MDSIKKIPAYVIYKISRLLDQSVSTLDPLDLDSEFISGGFSKAATSTDPELIKKFAGTVAASVRHSLVKSLDEVSAMAAARDLNMIASAITRFGLPLHHFPHLEEMLLTLAEITHEVPTDTVFGYGLRNPSGPRQRSFTKTKEESLFIESFSDGMVGLVAAIAGLETVQCMEITNPRFPELMAESSQHLRLMQQAIADVRRAVTPDFFTRKLRPFFDPKTIRGRTYFASGGAQMPVTMIDLILWGVEDTDRTYIAYRNENLQYLPRAYRSKIEVIMSKPSIVRSVFAQVNAGFSFSVANVAQDSIRSLQDIADALLSFRAPHLAVAKANLRIRATGAVGSGGYDAEILQYLIRKTKELKTSLTDLELKLASGPP